jgi:hypothetical protein
VNPISCLTQKKVWPISRPTAIRIEQKPTWGRQHTRGLEKCLTEKRLPPQSSQTGNRAGPLCCQTGKGLCPHQ